MPSEKNEKTQAEIDKERRDLETFEEAYERAGEQAKEDREFLKDLPPEVQPDLDNDKRFTEKALRQATIRPLIKNIERRKEIEDEQDQDRGR